MNSAGAPPFPGDDLASTVCGDHSNPIASDSRVESDPGNGAHYLRGGFGCARKSCAGELEIHWKWQRFDHGTIIAMAPL
jgi:hypothetical protein